jgi:hypothetical protein
MRVPSGAFAFLLIALALLTSCGDTRAAAVDSTTITIVCDPGAACVAKPDHLESWPKQIDVVSRETWKCEIVGGRDPKPCSVALNLPAGAIASIELRADQSQDRFVRLPVIDQSRGQRGAILPVLSLSTVLLTFLLAAWVAYLSWDSTTGAEGRMAAQAASIQDIERTIPAIVDTLVFPPAPEPRPSAAAEGASVPLEAEALKSEIGQFIQYVKDCFVGLGRVPDETETKIRDMQRLQAQIGRQIETATARQQYRTAARTLVRLALRAADDDFSKHRKRNPAAEAALGSLLEVAGYRLLDPKPQDKYSDGRHKASSRTERAASRNQHGYIARVERRGLLDAHNEVIEKAEVVLYDYQSY